MKRSHITTGLLGAVLSAGLLLAPVAAADTTTSDGSSEPSPTATASPTPTPDPKSAADSPEAPRPSSGGEERAPGAAEDPAEPGKGDAGAGGDPAAATPAEAGEAPPVGPADPAESADPAAEDSAPATAGAVVAGDPGMTSKNKQYSNEASIVSIHREGCVLTFEVQVNTAGTYTIAVWDDGAQVGTVEVGGTADEVVTATYTMGANVGTEAWGYDFVLKAGEAIVQMIDWNFEGSEEVMTQCAAEAVSEAPAAVTVTSKPAPGLARTGPAVGAGVLIALSLVGGGVALRRARRSA